MGVKVVVCRKCKHHACLLTFLEEIAGLRVTRVGCQKICKGAVTGIDVNGRMEWFERVDRPKPMVALARLAQRGGVGKISKPLAKRRVVKRSGRPIR
jgi:hypothetical protein